MSDVDRARRYLSAVPPALQGERNDSLNKLAFQLLERFQLAERDFESLLLEWAGGCNPPIAESEALKTIHSAWRGAHAKGVIGSKGRSGYPNHSHQGKAPATRTAEAPRYDLEGAQELPESIDDGARLLIRTVFQSGEGIRIVNAKLDEEKGGEVPDGSGPCLSREEWLRKLDKVKGNPNGIFSSSKKTGIYIAINPLKIGGSKDSDVTAYRHALVEFDEGLSPEEQFNLYQQSKLPCAAVIYSGGKSVHAWVKIDARDRREYDERVRLLYQHFQSAGYHFDPNNKNPGRLSRLPNCVRFKRRQELLALNTGTGSFSEWIKHIDGESLGSPIRFSDLIALDTSHDPNCLIGFRDGKTLRYLCKGKSGWILGPSGIGKSSLIAEFAIAWALGNPIYGIAPVRPLKSLIVQAENDACDLAEMVQGIARAHGLDPFKTEALFEQVDANVIFRTETRSVGPEFVDKLHRMIDHDRPDLVWLDPFLSFAGIDVSKQDQVTQFLRTQLNPMLESTGVVCIGVHHTGKPRSARESASWNAIDWAYAGLGSSELVNWARAVMMLRPISDFQFELKLAKRGKRAWATGLDGEFTTSVWLQHSSTDIRWEQIAPPGDSEKPTENERSKGGRPSKVKELAACNLHDALSRIPSEGDSANALGERLHKLSRKLGKTLGDTKCRTDLLDALIENGKLTFNEEKERYFKGPNA